MALVARVVDARWQAGKLHQQQSGEREDATGDAEQPDHGIDVRPTQSRKLSKMGRRLSGEESAAGWDVENWVSGRPGIKVTICGDAGNVKCDPLRKAGTTLSLRRE
jgi:hypothetical protein